MQFRPRRRESPEIMVIPLIDVLLMLLIFFMLATTFEREADMKIDLPRAGVLPEERKDEPLELVVSRDGRYFIGGAEVVNTGVEALKRALSGYTRGRRDLHLSIRAAAEVPHQAVVTAMDAAGQLGITRLSIATLHSEGER